MKFLADTIRLNELSVPEKQPVPLFIIDVWFLEDLIRRLTPGKDEEVVYITGNAWENLRMPYRMCDIVLQSQSPVHAKGTPQSCSDALIEIIEKGFLLQMVAHSHPGYGRDSTIESGIDINYLGKIQRNGADIPGIIVSRGGYVHFYTVSRRLDINIQGTGVEYVGNNTIKLLSA